MNISRVIESVRSLCRLVRWGRSVRILILGSEVEIKRKLLQRNFQDCSNETRGCQSFDEFAVTVEESIHFRSLDITPDRLEDQYAKELTLADGILFLTTPGYEEYDQLWVEAFRETPMYADKIIVCLAHPDSDIFIPELNPVLKVFVAKPDHEQHAEEAFNTIIQAIIAKNQKRKLFALSF